MPLIDLSRHREYLITLPLAGWAYTQLFMIDIQWLVMGRECEVVFKVCDYC